MPSYAYFAIDGNYGDASDLVIVDTSTFTHDDHEYLDQLPESDRATEALAMALNRDSIAGPALVATDDEIYQMVETLEGVIEYLTSMSSRNGFVVGWAEQLGDIRDVLTKRVMGEVAK